MDSDLSVAYYSPFEMSGIQDNHYQKMIWMIILFKAFKSSILIDNSITLSFKLCCIFYYTIPHCFLQVKLRLHYFPFEIPGIQTYHTEKHREEDGSKGSTCQF